MLTDFFREHPKIALAFSGGVDSSYLLYAALQSGAQVRAYYVKTQFQPEFEREDAMRLAKALSADLIEIRHDVLSHEIVAENPADRCYHCKHALFGMILDRARADGFTELMDGTNASDDAADRHGMRAVAELSVYSPLRLAGIDKATVRRLSKEAGLFTWDKPAYACLATRVPMDVRITEDILQRVERAENAMFSLGFSDFRVRYLRGAARIQLPEGQFSRFLEKRKEVLAALQADFPEVLLDMKAR